jgi:hypothetical protein
LSVDAQRRVTPSPGACRLPDSSENETAGIRV